jgi:hypothetical protein
LTFVFRTSKHVDFIAFVPTSLISCIFPSLGNGLHIERLGKVKTAVRTGEASFRE